MNISSVPPLMHSPQIMSTHHLQPSPFSPDQFLTYPTQSIHASSSKNTLEYTVDSNQVSLSQTFIKKRPLEVTEDLVAGRSNLLSQRLRPGKNHCTVRSATPEFDFRPAIGFEHTTPPNRLQSPISLVPRNVVVSRDVERLRHSPQSRRSNKSVRLTKAKRTCIATSPRKSPSRDSSPALLRSRSPLGRWTPPPAMSTFQLFSVEAPTLPATPPRPTSSDYFNPPPHAWASNFPWTIASPLTSPYPSHSPPPHSEHHT
ncbi:hypothetical protein K439DRAFT_135038 [Ramaria rubella]|nr:hypothetical protein K439DRAFT_135038 [Ramaria rubella]